MSACAHRPEDGCAFKPCAAVGGRVCASEVAEEIAAEQAVRDGLQAAVERRGS